MISDDHLDWALTHLTKYGASDAFPPSHDFHAMRHNWNEVKTEAYRRISTAQAPETPCLGMAPKPDNTFRAVHSLSSIDTLIATAVMYSICGYIEKNRIPEDQECVFSYRLDPDHNGNFFKAGSETWNDFSRKRRDLMSEFSSGYVLKADISDFYNQIYLHRVQNALEECLPADKANIARFMHDFLHGINTKVSKGIPVGPAFSTVIAESVLIDVDQRIRGFGLKFIRWVDDFYVFHHDYWILYNKYQELSEYLYSTHRLVFNGAKTRLVSTKDLQEFLDGNEDSIVDEQIKTLREARYSEMLEELISDLDPYDHSEVDWDELNEDILERYSSTEEFRVASNAYATLFSESLRTCNFTLLKHVIKKCTAAKIRSIAPLIRENLFKLLPVIREVAYYVKRAYTDEMLSDVAIAARHLALVIENGFTLQWLAYIISQAKPGPDQALTDEYYRRFEIPDQLLLATQHGNLFRIKALRTKVDQLPERHRHAYILSLSALTKDERNPILNSLEQKGRIMDKAFCRYVKSGITRW